MNTNYLSQAPPSNTNLLNIQHSMTSVNAAYAHEPAQRTQQPIVTGTSVLGIVYKDGVMLAADMLGSYGSLARFRDIQRLHPVNENTVIGVSGDISDYQYLQFLIDGVVTQETLNNTTLSPKNIHEYLSNLFYSRRTKMNPLWNKVVVAGVSGGKRHLSYVDLLGTTYESTTIATGYGAMLALPLLRKHVEGNEDKITEEEAKKMLEESMRVLFYRDARSLNKIQIATVTEQGVKVSEPYSLDTEWGFGADVKGYGASG